MPKAARNLDFSAGGSGGSNEDVPESPNNKEYNSSEHSDGNYYKENEEIPDLKNDTQTHF